VHRKNRVERGRAGEHIEDAVARRPEGIPHIRGRT
jgi:hypothetical protein